MQLRKIYQPTETEKQAKSAQARGVLTRQFLKAKRLNVHQQGKPVYKSNFRPSADRLEEILKAGEKLPEVEITEGKTFRKW